MTGQLGNVMNESANLAYSYVRKILQAEISKEGKAHRKNSENNKIEDFLSGHEIHLHLPAGATPKDGPSAGITMAMALYSLAMNKKVRSTLAMTGELSLTGKVHPVGGIKEKVLAAHRAGIKELLLPQRNRPDLVEVPKRVQRELNLILVQTMDEVLARALAPESD